MNLRPEQLRDLHAVMLADGQWYEVEDPTMPPGGYLSFLQRWATRNESAVMVNVELTDIKAVAYYALPQPARLFKVWSA